MGTSWFTHFREFLDKTISWKVNCNCVLSFGGNFTYELQAAQDNIHSGVDYAAVVQNLRDAIKEK